MKSVSIGSCNLVEASSSHGKGTSWSSVCESVGIISSLTSPKGKTLGMEVLRKGLVSLAHAPSDSVRMANRSGISMLVAPSDFLILVRVLVKPNVEHCYCNRC